MSGSLQCSHRVIKQSMGAGAGKLAEEKTEWLMFPRV